MQVEDFDDEAELNARIWNNFMKASKEDDGFENMYALNSSKVVSFRQTGTMRISRTSLISGELVQQDR